MTSSTGAELTDETASTGANGTTNGHAPPAAEAGPAAVPPQVAPAEPLSLPAAPTPPPAATGPRLLRREVWVDVPEYPGFRIRVWINYPQHWDLDLAGDSFRPMPDHEGATVAELDAWRAEKEAFQRAAYGRVVLEHNGWLDYDGNPLPPPQDPRFWELIPTELAATVVVLMRHETHALPNSIRPRSRR